MANTRYTVTEGQRWDQVAYLAYGKASAFAGIIAANPLVPITTRLPGGLVLQVPIIEDNSLLTDKESRPPWKSSL